MAIRERVSEILDMPIRPGRWLTYLTALNAEGRPDRITTLRIIMTMCEEMEILESSNARLLYRLEQLEEKLKPAEPAVEPEIAPIPPVTTAIGADPTDNLTEEGKLAQNPVNEEEPPFVIPPLTETGSNTPTTAVTIAQFACDFPGCTFTTTAKIGLAGHKRSHKTVPHITEEKVEAKDATPNGT